MTKVKSRNQCSLALVSARQTGCVGESEWSPDCQLII